MPLKLTVSGAGPLVGLAPATAVGAPFEVGRGDGHRGRAREATGVGHAETTVTAPGVAYVQLGVALVESS